MVLYLAKSFAVGAAFLAASVGVVLLAINYPTAFRAIIFMVGSVLAGAALRHIWRYW